MGNIKEVGNIRKNWKVIGKNRKFYNNRKLWEKYVVRRLALSRGF